MELIILATQSKYTRNMLLEKLAQICRPCNPSKLEAEFRGWFEIGWPATLIPYRYVPGSWIGVKPS